MKKIIFIIFLLYIILILVSPINAQPVPQKKPVTHNCVTKVANFFDIPYALIIAVMDVEWGYVGFKRKNTNGTYDYGPMQINSIWLPELGKKGISKEKLLYDGCSNVIAGAWILNQRLKNKKSKNILESTADYHSYTAHLNKAYQKKIRESLLSFLNGRKISSVYERANKDLLTYNQR